MSCLKECEVFEGCLKGVYEVWGVAGCLRGMSGGNLRCVEEMRRGLYLSGCGRGCSVPESSSWA